MLWRIAARWPFRLVLWRLLAARCEADMRDLSDGARGCHRPLDHREGL